MVGLHVDAEDPTPPFEQLRRQLSALISSGTLAEGARLPSVRQLAADLGLATGTVARTYRELERSGLVHSRRGAGTVVAAGRRGLTEAERRERLTALADALVAQSRLVGAEDEEIREAVDLALERVGAASARSRARHPHG